MRYVIITDHFSGTGRAVDLMCVCVGQSLYAVCHSRHQFGITGGPLPEVVGQTSRTTGNIAAIEDS